MSESIHVCPLCFAVADHSDDYGWSVSCDHPPYESIEPVEVGGVIEGERLVFALPDPEEWKRTVGAETLAKQEERDRKRAEWLALSCDERVATREKQRAAQPFAFMMSESIRNQYGSQFLHLLGESEWITVPCPRCQDAECENATRKRNPHYVSRSSLRGGYTIQMQGGSTSS
jgi:hypothetical protein